MSEFEPTPGDLIWTDFDPRTGREQGGRCPALVVSPKPLFSASRFIIVCPITSRVRPFASSVVLPPGLSIGGEILTSHVRSIDTLARPITYAGGNVPAAILAEVRAKLAVLIGIHGQETLIPPADGPSGGRRPARAAGAAGPRR